MNRKRDLSWQERAACIDADTEIFFGRSYALAKSYCRACPVRRACLADILAVEMPAEGEGVYVNRELRDGVSGGLTAIERWEMTFPAEAEHYKQREAGRIEYLKAYKRQQYAEMTIEQRRAARGSKRGNSAARAAQPA